ncbi:hypothetical protein EKK58_06015 [Candidatus Dependentiae bacterium]|nr:MAG: hypothetical protein EKK58_06015 [Candidatus Dependentiae bacterium]
MTKNETMRLYQRAGKNFMTPDVLEVAQTDDNRIIELSTGTGINGAKIWGVTEFDEYGKTTRRGQMHTSLKSARKHFNVLLGAW